jgi:propionate CoA-transferase
MEKEALFLDSLDMAIAAKNSGLVFTKKFQIFKRGFVICQVERVAAAGSLPAKQVKIPGIMVDYVVISNPENQLQTYASPYNPGISDKYLIIS